MTIPPLLKCRRSDYPAVVYGDRIVDGPAKGRVNQVVQVLNRTTAIVHESMPNQITWEEGTTHYSAIIVYGVGLPVLPAERAEIGHRAAAIEERLFILVSGSNRRSTNDLS